MPIIVIDGPEKAGKSTLATILEKQHGALVRHWGPVKSEEDFRHHLFVDCQADHLTVWDRSWASESVYSQLLNRGRRLGADPWYGEWIFGRAVNTVGTRAMILGPDVTTLRANRDDTDLPVDPWEEREAFLQYGIDFNVPFYVNEHTIGYAEGLAAELAKRAWHRWARRPVHAGFREYTGLVDKPPVLILGEARSGHPERLPFTSAYTTRLARSLGNNALRCAWTNVHAEPVHSIISAEQVVACGKVAEQYANDLRGGVGVTAIPHPAWMYRWGSVKGDMITESEGTIARVVNSAL